MGGIFVDFSVVNQLNSPALNSNTFANRPAAGQIGRLFISTDTFEIYRDNGTTWDLIGGPGTSTITGTGTANFLPKFTGAQSIGDSIVSEGTNLINIGGTNSRLVLSGTDDGSSQLQTYSNNNTRWKFQVSSDIPLADADITGYRTRGTIAAPTAILQGDAITNYFGSGYDGTVFQNSGGFEIFAEENFTPSSGGTYLSFLTTNLGNTVSNEKVRLTANGNLGINEINPQGYLHINGGANVTRSIIDADNNIARILSFRTSGSQRWALRVDGNETGADTGANFQLRRYDDTGAFIDASLIVNRATGKKTFNATQNYTSGLASGNTMSFTLNVPNGTTFTSPNSISPILASMVLNLAGNATIASGSRTGADFYNAVGFSGVGTLTMSQAATIRALSNLKTGWAYNGSAIGTITHSSGINILFPDNSGQPLNITNNYALLINRQDANTGTITYTNRWGIYQEGSADLNYLNGNLLIKSTTDNGSALQVTGQATIFGNIGINTTPSAWGVNPFALIELGINSGFIAGRKDTGNQLQLGTNAYFDGTNWIYKQNLGASRYVLSASSHAWFIAAAGTGTITWSQAMTLDASGNVGIGTNLPSQRLEVAGIIRGEAVNVYGSSNPASTSPYLYSPSLGAFGFGNAGSERMRITSGGNVLIGTTTDAGQKLQVSGTSYLNGNVGIGTTSTTFRVNISDTFQDYTSGLFNVEILTTTPQSEGRGGSIGFSGQTGGGPESFACIYGGKANNTFAETGGRLGLMTRSNGGPMSERLRIKPNGQTRFIPLAADPAGAEAGDVYYNSGTNKLRLYDGTNWVDLN